MFDGPQRAIRCAMSIRDAVQTLGIQVRAGLHTGECEVRGDDIGGIAVHIGARVAALAGPNGVLVSRTLRDLVIGSGLEFEDAALTRSRGTRRVATLRRRLSVAGVIAARLNSPAVSSLCTTGSDWLKNTSRIMRVSTHRRCRNATLIPLRLRLPQCSRRRVMR